MLLGSSQCSFQPQPEPPQPVSQRVPQGFESTYLQLQPGQWPFHRFQSTIIDHIQEETTPLSSAIIRLEEEITLLREYRTRLIADVVTGKLDVREVAAWLPEDVEPSIQSDAASYDGDDAEDDPGSDPIDTEED